MAALALEPLAPLAPIPPPISALISPPISASISPPLLPPLLPQIPPQIPAQIPAPTPPPTPAPTPAPTRVCLQSSIDDGDGNVCALLRLRDRLKEQLAEVKEAVLVNQENFVDQLKINAIEENLIQSATKDLQKSIEEAKVSHQNKNLALKRVQIMEAMRNKLEQDDEDSRLILETMKQIELLSRTIMEYQQQLHQNEERMIDIKRKRLCLKVDEGQKVRQIQTTMKTQEEKQASVNVTETEKNNKLEQERQMTTIIQNVFQNLIIGSQVNWAEDPALKAIVLQLENNVYLH
ncbi:hypothetical protein HGM15179_004750 [Zosterops borbonicus]|uniref:Centromere protein H C-terminal domain-containing protein n=1 Tax=Zosterops borbonicus TaxID=364589 RepID=A0A8K1LPX7_9PASS|nr:hypothetical protein HGM15179_004750 [Zosterops borbonicus]